MSTPLAVLLMDYGAPASDEQVRPFIASLLADPAILPLPPGLRHGLAWFIAARRAPRVAVRYQAIGGSPLPAAVSQLARAVDRRLGSEIAALPAYCHAAPRIGEVVAQLARDGCQRVVGLPLFPQRSWTTSDVCERLLERAAAREGLSVAMAPAFSKQPGLLSALAAGTLPLLGPGCHVLMVAHGLPERLEQRGDPYVTQVRRTAALLAAELPEGTAWSLAFQSRLGPAAWVRPYLEDEIQRLASEGLRHLVLVPLSFACENLETRWDLDTVAAEQARELGIARFDRCPAPAEQPAFLDLLAELARSTASQAGWGRDDQRRSA